MAIVPNFYINAVLSLGIKKKDDSISWIGTGFFVLRKVNKEGDARPFIVTNKHVVEGLDSIVVRMKESKTGNLINVDTPLIENGKSIAQYHKNPNIDIAVIPLNGSYIVKNGLDFSAFDIDEHAMTSQELRDNGVDEGTLIHMLGFPLGLVNNKSGEPLCRLGCVARMNTEQINESGNILVDIQNFPGNSGSPIITRSELVSIEGTTCLSSSVLLGIVHSYIPYKEFLVSKQTDEIVEIRSENSGIANVHPVEFIREIIDTIQPVFKS